MANFSFELVSPERVLFSGTVAEVVVPGTDGDMTILSSHAPVMTTLRAGVVTLNEGQGAPKRLYVAGGFADVTAAGLTILAELAIAVEDISVEKVSADIRDAEEDLRDAKSDELRDAAQDKIASLKSMLAAVLH